MRSLLFTVSCVLFFAGLVIPVMHFLFDYSLEQISLKVGLIAATVSAVAVIYAKAIKPLFDHASNVSRLMEEIQVIVQKHKGLDFDALVSDVRKIIIDLKPNSGTSLRDAIDRIEARIIVMEKTNDAFHQDGPAALFRCRPDGYNIDVNRTYCRYLKCTKEELLGYGWRNFLSGTSSLGEHDKSWKEPFLEGREVEFKVDYEATDGTSVGLDVHAYPIVDKSNEVVQYLGLLYPRPDSPDPELDR